MEIILVPHPVLAIRRCRLDRARDVLDVVAAGSDEAAHPLRPQRRDDASASPAPVEADEQRGRQPQRIHEVEEVLAERALLAGARRLRRQELRRPVATQVRHDGAAAGRDERRHHAVIGAGIVGKAVHHEHRQAALGPAVFVGDVERLGADAF